MRPHTERFSDRVADYVRHRPSYPDGVIAMLRTKAGLTRDANVADVGSGTGIFARLLLPHCARVFGVEPNAAMRAAAERELAHEQRFTSIDGTAEQTTLANTSVDLVTAAQAFHWFEPAKCRGEFARILKPGGRVALVWNLRLTDATPFLQDYETLLRHHAPEYVKISETTARARDIEMFFEPHGYETAAFDYAQHFDFAGLSGRLLSSSYAPNAGQPGHEAMMRGLRTLFDRHHQNGSVAFLYKTRLYIGYFS